MRPQQLALRSVNQYRTRDVLAYLGLRYYFANHCATRDRWAHDVASHLLMTRTRSGYFKSLHFKDIRESGLVDHREVFIPGPNESFAETALLAECSKHHVFHPLPCVFSYRLAKENSVSGVYMPYFSGLQERHQKIADACKERSGSVVLYTDIKRFYPNIPAAKAMTAWEQACVQAQLDSHHRDLGVKLLSDYFETAKTSKHCKGLLTGPMFSHLIANLVLRGVDEKMSALFPGCYFRYVDDIVLVGDPSEIFKGRQQLSAYLEEIELALHDRGQGKDFEVPAEEWMKGAHDFDGTVSNGWKLFSRDLKQFLISQPTERHLLARMLSAEGFRIPLPDYLVATREASYLERIQDLSFRYPWFRGRLRRTTSMRLLLFAKLLRSHYFEQVLRLLDSGRGTEGYIRKRTIPKIRYFSGRLLFLGSTESLAQLAPRLREYPELTVLAEIMEAVARRDVSRLLPLGGNLVQSAAQALRQSDEAVECSLPSWDAASRQGLAILRANGIEADGPVDDELNRFALWRENGGDLMESEDPFIKELACLHGTTSLPRHSTIFETAFDRSEELAFDVINQLRDSDYA